MCVTQVTGKLPASFSSPVPILEIATTVVLSFWKQVQRHPCISIPLGFIRQRQFPIDFHLLHWDSSSKLHGAFRAKSEWFGRYHQSFLLGKNMLLRQTCGLTRCPGYARHNLIWAPVLWLYYHNWSIAMWGNSFITFNWYFYLNTENKIFLIWGENWTIVKSWEFPNPIEMKRCTFI